MGTSFPLDPVPSVEPARRIDRDQRARAVMPPTRFVEDLSREIRMSRPATYEIPAKLGQTWARERAFEP
jgi:hypothetical protein